MPRRDLALDPELEAHGPRRPRPAHLSRRRSGARALVALAGALAGCDEVSPLAIARCGSDLECRAGEICEVGECVSKDTVSCVQVEGGRALLQPTPHQLALEGAGTATVTLRNIGDCTLTIFEASLSNVSNAENGPYSCAGCAVENFPIELFPFRDRALTIQFSPPGVGTFSETLEILSDDAEFPTLIIPLEGRFDGAPMPRVVPETFDFGYVAVGQSATVEVIVSNQGTGVAPLTVTTARIEPTATTAFSLEAPLAAAVELAPVGEDPRAAVQLRLRYHPREVGAHAGALVVETTAGALRVPVRGTSRTAPEILVSPERVTFGTLPLGHSDVRTLLIQNPGGAPLMVTPRLGGPGATDFSLSPPTLPPIPPGGYVEAQVFATATAPRAFQGLLWLDTNTPTRPTVTVPLSAEGRPVPGAEVLKIEMAYGNEASSFFDDDVRNVDMNLENPFGLVCGKQDKNPTNWGPYGHPSWLAFGPNEEPERIVLPDASQDGTFRVMLSYAEDCSSVPTGLVASVLGVSVDVLVGYFSGGAVPLDGEDVSRVIGDLCVSRSPASVVVTVYANGQVIQEVPVILERKGDHTYALDIVRTEGVLHVVP